MALSGPIKFGSRTKELVVRLEPGDIAAIDHADIDELAAESLIGCRVAGVVNFSSSMTGRYPCPGPKLLVEAGLPLLDLVDSELRLLLQSHSDSAQPLECTLAEEGAWVGGKLYPGTWRDLDWVEETLAHTQHQLQFELASFVENTLEYALREARDILKPQSFPKLSTPIQGRHVLVSVRGTNYRDDLEAVRGYLSEFRPVLIGVDGGADALLDLGWRPDIILGDMDSVSDRALLSGAELIVHAYPDGRAPGRTRLEELRCPFVTLPLQGTSEDAALLLAYEQEAELIVAVGTHTSVVDFLEKGRPGMASTLLVRLKVAAKLVDAKGVSKIYRRRFRSRYAAALVLGAMIPLGALAITLTPLQILLRILILRVRLWTGL